MDHFKIPPYYADNARGFRNVRVTPKPYGYRIIRVNNYITVQYVKIEYNVDGSCKATVRNKTNYVPEYQFTLYFDSKGNEIKGSSTLAERKTWLALQKQNNKTK